VSIDLSARIAFLKKIHIFSGLKEEDFAAVAETLEEMNVPKGGEIFKQDGPAETFYMIYGGSVRIIRKQDGKEYQLALLVKNDYFGELALVSNRRRSATVTAIEDTSMLVLSRAEFQKFMSTDAQFFYTKPQDMLAAYRDIAKRADAELPKLFAELPRLPYGIRPMEAYEGDDAEHRDTEGRARGERTLRATPAARGTARGRARREHGGHVDCPRWKGSVRRGSPSSRRATSSTGAAMRPVSTMDGTSTRAVKSAAKIGVPSMSWTAA